MGRTDTVGVSVGCNGEAWASKDESLAGGNVSNTCDSLIGSDELPVGVADCDEELPEKVPRERYS